MFKKPSNFYQHVKGCGEREKILPMPLPSKENDTLIGMFGLHPMKLKIEVGYALARPYWGKGYMTETLRAVIVWAFTQPDIFRVQAFCDVENLGSARVMEKAGMMREGLLRRYVLHPNISDEPRDAYLYAIVK